jgi:hypothetical protein
MPALWKTADGRKVVIGEMTDEHLVNTFAYARRKFQQETGAHWMPQMHLPQSLKLLGFKLEALFRECSMRKLNWSLVQEPTDKFDRGAGDSTGLLDTLIVSAASARTPAAKGYDMKPKRPKVVRFSINLDEERDS